MSDIREQLRDLITLQDSVTHENEAGRSALYAFKRMHEERNQIIDAIADRVAGITRQRDLSEATCAALGARVRDARKWSRRWHKLAKRLYAAVAAAQIEIGKLHTDLAVERAEGE